MTELLTAAQMRAIETAAIESGEVTGLELMERAGRGVVEAVFEEWPELAETSHRAVVLCGPGNNGGDGFVVARLLKEWGWEVDVFLYGDPGKLPPDARVNYERWLEMGEVYDFLAPREEFPEHLFEIGAEDDGVVLDALFGTGLSRAIDHLARMRLSEFQTLVPLSFLRTVAVDMPSGICSDSGKWLIEESDALPGLAVELCVAFHRAKVGHYVGEPLILRNVVKDIGLDELGMRQSGASARAAFSKFSEVLSSSDDPRLTLNEILSAEAKSFRNEPTQAVPAMLITGVSDEVGKSSDHKYSHGHALVLSGGPGTTGAARLAARGALRIGAGLVTLGVPLAAEQEVASQITALMLRRVEDGQGLSDLLQDKRLNALCLGPGLGIDRARDLVPAALAATSGGLHPPYRSVVLDADALTAFQDAPEDLFEVLHERCVLTPHAGEFARLFPDIAAKLGEPPTRGPAYSKVDATREAAKRAGCVVLFKGPDTVIAAPDGMCSVNSAQYERAAPGLATAGSGDVLAGFITGLLARGLGPMQAAETAAWLHVECARSFGPGLIAEDLPEELPKVFREMGL